MSFYIDENMQGRGFGNVLLKNIVLEGKKPGLHVILARVAEGNDVSIHLLEKHGFFHIGVLKEVGLKFGKLLDVHLMERVF